MQGRPDRLLGMLGLCRRAGKLVLGTELVCLAMAERKKPCLVLVCAEASENTRKKVRTKSEYYCLPCREAPLSPETLGQAVGKSGSIAAVAVTDENMAAAVARLLEEPEQNGKN